MTSYTFEDIARYASGEMDAGERTAFEAALAGDEALQQKLALHKEIQTSLQQRFAPNTQLQAFQQTLQQLNREYFAPATSQPSAAPVKRIRMISLLTTAAAAVVALLIWRPWQGGDLYTRYASVEMIAHVERGTTNDSLLTEATIRFNQKDYPNAIRLLKQITDAAPDNSFALFYYGISLTQTHQLPLARSIFLQLYNGVSVFKFDAAFYMALTYVAEKKNKEAATWLHKIPAEATSYRKAQALLKDL
jgi:tetratricopeptide (TPR) repeat protein